MLFPYKQAVLTKSAACLFSALLKFLVNCRHYDAMGKAHLG